MSMWMCVFSNELIESFRDWEYARYELLNKFFDFAVSRTKLSTTGL